MDKCQCVQTIGRYFSESGLITLIQEYALEYSTHEISRMLLTTTEAWFEWGGLFKVRYGDGRLFFLTMFMDDHGVLICDPNDVVRTLETIAPTYIMNLYRDSTTASDGDISFAMLTFKMLADNIRDELPLYCHDGKIGMSGMNSKSDNGGAAA